MTLLRDSFGNEHRATPAIFALKEVPWIRIARTILSIFAANAQQSFPQGILSFLFFRSIYWEALILGILLLPNSKLLPHPLSEENGQLDRLDELCRLFFRCAL